jgi:excisionase family DNA binding protein
MEVPVEETLVYTVPEVQFKLKISKSTVYAAIRDGRLPSLRLGRKVLVPKEALRAWLAGNGELNEKLAAPVAS